MSDRDKGVRHRPEQASTVSPSYETCEPYYFADGDTVHKRPVAKRDQGENATRISIGFPVCVMHEACIGQAENVARLMNQGDQFDELRDALENLVIAIGMGWDLDGVVEVARAALAKAKAQEGGE